MKEILDLFSGLTAKEKKELIGSTLCFASFIAIEIIALWIFS